MSSASNFPDCNDGAMSATVSGRIGKTAEWRLINDLRQISKLGSRANSRIPDTIRNPKWLRMLQIDLNLLDSHVRTIFTAIDLDILIQLDDEVLVEDGMHGTDFQSSPESAFGSTEGSYSDGEDTPSAWTAASAERRGNQALSHLVGLCEFLEERVNTALFAARLTLQDSSADYPNLSRLVRTLQSDPMLQEPNPKPLQFIPIPGSRSTSFLFNIVSENASTAIDFSNLPFPEVAGTPEGPDWRLMFKEVQDMRSQFQKFIDFVSNLNNSPGSLDILLGNSVQSLTSSASSPSFEVFQAFRQQASSAFRAVFSQFGLCTASPEDHKVFLALPDCRPTEESSHPPVQFFFTSCLNDDGQLAKAYSLQTKDDREYRQPRLCHALERAYVNDQVLNFFVKEDSRRTIPRVITIYTPSDENTMELHEENFNFPFKSSVTLLEEGFFASKPSVRLLASLGLDEAKVFRNDQRKDLAIKLVLGLMLSLDSDFIIATWNLERIHLLKPKDENTGVYVAIHDRQDITIGPRDLSLARWDRGHGHGANDNYLGHFLPFTLLAKALLEIGCGERFAEESNDARTTSRDRKMLQKLIKDCTTSAISGHGISREVLPFLAAARSCLDFHVLYEKHAMIKPPRERMANVWQVVFTDILPKIDSKLRVSAQAGANRRPNRVAIPLKSQIVVGESIIATTENPAETISNATANLQTPSPSERPAIVGKVQLFDGEDATSDGQLTLRAKDFLGRLQNFHQSYSSLVKERDKTESGKEMPQRIRIAILDTGIDFTHPGLLAAKGKRVKKAWCHSWVGDEEDVKDEDPGLHGTNCAYIMNKAAPEADIYIAKVFSTTEFRSYQAENIAKAVKHAVHTWKVDIISMSFGLRRPTGRSEPEDSYQNIINEIEDAMEDAEANHCVMFAAASNQGISGGRAFPARYPSVICVHASDGLGVDGGLNPDPESIDFMTLGMGMELMEKSGRAFKIVHKSGTSFATPMAAGVAATVLDLVSRVNYITDQTRRKLKTRRRIRSVLELMALPTGQRRYLALWNKPKHCIEEGPLPWGLINREFEAR